MYVCMSISRGVRLCAGSSVVVVLFTYNKMATLATVPETLVYGARPLPFCCSQMQGQGRRERFQQMVYTYVFVESVASQLA